MMQKSTNETILRRIANTLILNTSEVRTMGLPDGKMGVAVFLFYYARFIDNRYEEYADQLIEELTGEIQKIRQPNYADGLAGVGAGIEHLIQHGFIEGDSNEVLEDFDKLIHHTVSYFSGRIDIRNGITGYGKYYNIRLNNPNNYKKNNPHTEPVKEHLIRIVDLLSASYNTYEDIYSVINFLPDVIDLDINREKACAFFYYAVDLLETTVCEDEFFGNYPKTFNPLIAAVLLFNASVKINDNDLAARALYFLDRYESGFRLHLSEKHAIKWAFLYHTLWKICNRDIYKELSAQWMEKITDDSLNFEHENLITSGMMLLSMNNSINDDWLNCFPLH